MTHTNTRDMHLKLNKIKFAVYLFIWSPQIGFPVSAREIMKCLGRKKQHEYEIKWLVSIATTF